MAQTELDILQRELNEALLIYDPNPRKALREKVTRKNINAQFSAELPDGRNPSLTTVMEGNSSGVRYAVVAERVQQSGGDGGVPLP